MKYLGGLSMNKKTFCYFSVTFRSFTCLLLFFMVSSPVFALDKVVLQLKWLHQFQFAGYYAALEQGYFAEEGLDVELRERNTELSNIDQVLTGEADYGVTDSIVLLHHVQRSGIVLVAPIFQHSPNVLLSLRSSNINRPRDLIGRRLAFYDNNTDGISLLALLADQGVLEEGLIRDKLDNRIIRLINGDVDAIASYSTNEPYLLKEMGYEFNIIDPKHYGLDFYGDMFFTSATEAKNNPQRVAAMRRAVLKGWEYALDNKEELVQHILENYNTQNKTAKALHIEAQGLEPLIARHTAELGTLSPGRLEYMLGLLAKTNIIEDNLNHENFEQGLARLVFDGQQVNTLNLTEEELSYLVKHPVLRIGVDPNWPPFEYLGDNGFVLQGISSDYLKLLEELLNVEFEILGKMSWQQTLDAAEQEEIDLLPSITNTPERSRYLSFTQPYVHSPMVIVTDNRVSYIADMNELKNKRVAVAKSYASHEMLAKHHPYIQLDLKDSAIEAIKAVAAGEVDAFVENLAVASYLIRNHGLANLKISGQTPYSYDISMAVQKNNPILESIIEKALLSISVQQQNAIYDRWVSVEVAEKFPWRQVLLPVLALSLVLLLLGFYTVYLFNFNSKMQRINNWLKKTERELKEKNSQLEQVSITDKLTNIYNRHYLDKVLSEQFSLALRHNRPMSLALFDLDHFKKVNDTFGHPVGDKVLKVFAKLVQENIRKTDVFGRWGGEEFLLVFPETNKEQAYLAVEKIRLALQAYKFEEGFQQTVSAGIVEAEESLTLNEMLLLVDKKLYLAKGTGRNKVMS